MAIHNSEQDDKLDVARANAHFLTKKIELEKSFTDDDQKYAEWPKRNQEESGKILAESRGLIRNPRLAEQWQLSRQDDIAKSQATIEGRIRARDTDRAVAGDMEKIEVIRRQAVEEVDPDKRTELITGGRKLIHELGASGKISAVQAQALDNKWVTSYAEGKLELMSPEQRVAAVRGPVNVNQAAKSAYQFFIDKGWAPHQAAGIIGNLIQESSMRTTARNGGDGKDGSDSIGIGQWNSDRAARLKRYAAARGTDWHDFQTQLEFVDLELRTSEGKAGNALVSAKNVRDATAAMVMYERPAGSQRGAEYADGWGNRLRHAQAIHNAVGGGPPPDKAEGSDVAQLLSPERRATILNQAEIEIRQGQIKRANDQGESWERVIIDANAGKGALPDRSVLENDTILTEPVRNKLLGQYDKAAKEVNDIRLSMEKAANPNYTFNKADPDDKKSSEHIFVQEGGDLKALEKTVNRTGIIPDKAVTAMRGALVSNKPETVQYALTMATNMINNDPQVFKHVTDGNSLAEAALWFKHYSELLGPDEAAKKYVKEETPEYKAEMQKRAKATDVDAILKREIDKGNLKSDVESAFNESFLDFSQGWRGVGKPQLEFSQKARDAAVGEYADLVKDYFLNGNGDMALAKKLAMEKFKTIWNVTYVNGNKGVVMKFPPEAAPAYAGFENVSDAIAAQAMDVIKEQTGKDVDRKKIMLAPTPGGRTSAAYFGGKEVPYTLTWFDENDHLQVAQMDFKLLKAPISEARRKQFEDERAKPPPSSSIGGPNWSPLGALGGAIKSAIPDAGAAVPDEPVSDRPAIRPGDFGGKR